ncbi:aminoglycoside phosphotransferase, partial [Burkholderia multivorans]
VMEGPTILGLLDWTTAAVGDPARDFAFHQASVSPEAFDLTVDRYVENGGKGGPKLAEHCAHLFSTAAGHLGLFALETDDEEHLAAAREQLGTAPRR